MTRPTSNRPTIFLAILLLLAIPFGCKCSRAQALDCVRRSINFSVIDRNWAPVTNVQPSDFQAEYDKKPVKILSVSRDGQKRRLVILLDASGSESSQETAPGAPPWELSVQLAHDLAVIPLPDREVALIIFNKKIIERVDFSSGR